jgi:hypothetical protein
MTHDLRRREPHAGTDRPVTSDRLGPMTHAARAVATERRRAPHGRIASPPMAPQVEATALAHRGRIRRAPASHAMTGLSAPHGPTVALTTHATIAERAPLAPTVALTTHATIAERAPLAPTVARASRATTVPYGHLGPTVARAKQRPTSATSRGAERDRDHEVHGAIPAVPSR